MPPRKKKNSWRSCKGRDLLFRDLRSGAIPDDMHWTDAYQLRPEFAVGETPADALRLFEGRLKRARASEKQAKSQSTVQHAAFLSDRYKLIQLAAGGLQLAPGGAIAPATTSGEPRWEGSEAERFLKQDIADKKHVGVLPNDLYKSRPEYQVFTLAKFRGHIKQEVATIKYINQRREKYGY